VRQPSGSVACEEAARAERHHVARRDHDVLDVWSNKENASRCEEFTMRSEELTTLGGGAGQMRGRALAGSHGRAGPRPSQAPFDRSLALPCGCNEMFSENRASTSLFRIFLFANAIAGRLRCDGNFHSSRDCRTASWMKRE